MQTSQPTPSPKRPRTDYQWQMIRESLPERYWNASAEGLPVQHFAENIEANIKQGNGLFITGTIGAGKTHCACAVAIAALDLHYRVEYLTGGDLVRRMIGAITAGSSEEQVMSELADKHVLIIDDLGREGMTRKTLARLFDVINDRSNKMLSTIYTSNYTEQALVQCWAETGDVETAKAIISRIVQVSKKIVMDGKDRRLS